MSQMSHENNLPDTVARLIIVSSIILEILFSSPKLVYVLNHGLTGINNFIYPNLMATITEILQVTCFGQTIFPWLCSHMKAFPTDVKKLNCLSTQ